MLNKFRNYLKSPDDNEPEYLRLVRNLLIFTLVANLLAILLTSGLVAEANSQVDLIALAITSILELISLILVIRYKKVLWGKFITPLALTIAVFFIAVAGSGLHDISLIALPIILIIAFLLQGNKAMATTLPVICAAIFIIGLLDISGVTQSVIAESTTVATIAIILVLIIASSAILRSLNERITLNLLKARQNEKAQIEAISQLRELQTTLEERVAIRTAELENISAANAKRAKRLQAISDISKIISSIKEQKALLERVTELISERLQYYHVGIFLKDDKQRYAVLRAANSEGGKAMLARGHQLTIGSQGLVGFAMQNSKARIALDVGQDAFFFNNPDLPGTHSEIALPLIAGNEVIGVLDVQSEESNAFSDEDMDVLGTLASQVAIAIENTRLLEEAQVALREVQETTSRYVRQEWGRQTATMENTGRIYTGSEIQPLQVELNLPKAGKTQANGRTLTVPIKLRGETIGLLGLQAREDGRTWTGEEITYLQAAAERVAIALENARLIESTQRKAAKERLIGEMASRIGASVNVDHILETAAKELGQAISGSEVIVQFKGKN